MTFMAFDAFFRVFVVHVAVALFCGGMIRLERQLRHKPAGMRVCMLVVVTSSFFVTLAIEVAPEHADRIMGSIITGVGFLGGGVILSQRGRVRGITTATLIWVLAAIGVTIGFDYPLEAIVSTLIVMGVLALVDALEARFPRLKPEFEEDQGTRHPGSDA